MIFVTLGTQDKPFSRLLEQIEQEIKKGNIKEQVIVQGGCTKFDTKNMTIFDQIEHEKFIEYIKQSDLIITHAGVGSIIDGLKFNKKIIAVPRLAKYGEAANDHQIQLVENFANEGYIIGVNDLNELDKGLKKVKKFKPRTYISNNQNFVDKLIDYIENINNN